MAEEKARVVKSKGKGLWTMSQNLTDTKSASVPVCKYIQE